MPKYFQLRDYHSDEVHGPAFPQTDSLTVFQAQLITPWHFFDSKPNLKYKLAKKALLTDVLTNLTSSSGFLINKKVKSIFEAHKLMRHQYFNAELVAGKDSQLYYFLHLTEPDLSNHIDFESSTFIEKDYLDEIGEISLESLEHYNELKAKDTMASFSVELKELQLKNTFNDNLDLFTFLPFTSEIIISERLKEAIESAGITGFEIFESNIIS